MKNISRLGHSSTHATFGAQEESSSSSSSASASGSSAGSAGAGAGRCKAGAAVGGLAAATVAM